MSSINMKEIRGECMYCTSVCYQQSSYNQAFYGMRMPRVLGTSSVVFDSTKFIKTLPLAFEPTTSQSWSKQITTALPR